MEIGQRDFLTIFGGLLANLALRRSPAVFQQDELYLNRRLGMAFSRPDGWCFISHSDMGEIQAGLLLELSDAQQNEAIVSSLDLPFVSLSTDDFSVGTATSSIQFYLAESPPTVDVVSELLHEAFGKEYKGNSELSYSLPIQIIRRDWQSCRELLDSVSVCSLPKDISVGGYPAAEYTARYNFRHRELHEPRPTRVRTVAIQHHSRFYVVRLVDTEARQFDFSPFLDTLRLA